MLQKFLFPSKPDATGFSLFILGFRILFGVLMITHGMQKWDNFDAMSSAFPDPLGVGSTVSLSLAIFAEVICSVAFILGALYRLALIPLIFTMVIAFFVIHAADPFSAKEPAFIYLMVYLMTYITGPGKFAVDRLLVTKKRSR